MPSEEVLWQHRAFDDLLSALEASKIGRQRIAEVVARLMIAAPGRPAQTEIAQGRGLPVPCEIPPDSVSRATAALSAMNLLTQHKPKADRPGRPYTPLQLGSSRWAMVGVKIGHEQGRAVTLNVLVTGLDGLPLKLPGYQSEDEPFVRDINEGDDLVEALGEAIEELCDLPAVRHRVILGVGVEIAGHVFEGVVVEASLNSMLGVQLGRQLSKRLDRLADRFDDRRLTRGHQPLPVIVDNDVNVLAVLETYRPRYPERDIAVVAVFDDGIGSGLIVDGRVYRGGRGMAGEIGHCRIPLDIPRDLEALAAVEAATTVPDTPSSSGAAPPPAPAGERRLPGFRDPCHCGGSAHLDCVTPVRVLGQLGEHCLADVARRPAEAGDGLTREGRAFQIAGQALGVGLAGLVNLLNPSRVLLFLPPALAQTQKPGTDLAQTKEPDTAAALYRREIRETLRKHAFSDSSSQTALDIEPFSPEQRRFFGAKAAAVRVLDSFVQHGKHWCKCYVPRAKPDPITSIETDPDQQAGNDDLVAIS
jgi:predicted NBD/HSP70 family sugar kinase